MKLLDAIRVPWSPYTLMFSRDGTRLAIGGGSFYGNGGIILRDLANGAETVLDWSVIFRETELFPTQKWDDVFASWQHTPDHPSVGINGTPAVSGMYFSDDDRYLAVSMWSARWSYAPTIVLAIDSDGLTLHGAFHGRHEFLCCHTGVLMRGGVLVTRRNHLVPFREDPATNEHAVRDPIAVHRLPPDWQLHASGVSDHLTHSRVIVHRNAAITPLCGLQTMNPEGRQLVIRPLDGSGDQLIPLNNSAGVTAISRLALDSGFLTAGWHGEIDWWRWDEGWRSTRVRPLGDSSAGAISGIVSTAAGRIVAAHAGGELVIDPGGDDTRVWMLPVNGYARSLAAHPSREWVAVGMKQGGWAEPASTVAVVELG